MSPTWERKVWKNIPPCTRRVLISTSFKNTLFYDSYVELHRKYRRKYSASKRFRSEKLPELRFYRSDTNKTAFVGCTLRRPIDVNLFVSLERIPRRHNRPPTMKKRLFGVIGTLTDGKMPELSRFPCHMGMSVDDEECNIVQRLRDTAESLYLAMNVIAAAHTAPDSCRHLRGAASCIERSPAQPRPHQQQPQQASSG